MAIAKPFLIKGTSIFTPKGEALFCKVVEPDYRFNAKGVYETSLVCDRTPVVEAFIEKIQTMSDTALAEARDSKGEAKIAPQKLKTLTQEVFYKDEYDKEGNETGRVVFKFKMNNVDDLPKDKNKVKVVDSKGITIKNVPLVGNGSTIKCKIYANPYYMATTNKIGVSFKWEAMQIIDLVSFNKDAGFDVEEGSFVNVDVDNPFDVEDDVDNGDF